MRKLILIISVLCLYILNYNIVKADDNNLGLYGFYLGQNLSEIIKNVNDKNYKEVFFRSSNYQFDNDNKNTLYNEIKSKLNDGIKLSIDPLPNYVFSIPSTKINMYEEFNKKMDNLHKYFVQELKNYNDKFKISIDNLYIYSNGVPSISIQLLRKGNDYLNSTAIRIDVNDLIECNISDKVKDILIQRLGNNYTKFPYNFSDGFYWNINNSGVLLFPGKNNKYMGFVVFISPLSNFKDFIDYYNYLYKSIKDSEKTKALDGI